MTDAADWWETAIIDMKPGEIRYRGYAVEELIGNDHVARGERAVGSTHAHLSSFSVSGRVKKPGVKFAPAG